MKDIPHYPLRFEPIHQYRPWGGRRLGGYIRAPLPSDDPIGEAWMLSDRDDHPSLVADGPLKGRTIRDLLEQSPERLLGRLAGHCGRFPLLLKFLDASNRLSVQVHPSDAYANLTPTGDTGKDEAWVVLEEGPQARIYAGLKPGTTSQILRQALASGTVADRLSSFVPKPADAVFISAGTVHSLSDVVVFEVQENSDVTFRLYDWDRIDPKTGPRRPLQVNQAMACIDFGQAAIRPAAPRVQATTPVRRERLVQCDHFNVTRSAGEFSLVIGKRGMPSALVCLAGEVHMEHADIDYSFGRGDVALLSAEVGECRCRAHGIASLLEISLPEVA
jgi:mannose-6-phosphate isomerase